jgi:hypothetical protein
MITFLIFRNLNVNREDVQSQNELELRLKEDGVSIEASDQH